jgi:hypothetical protein
MINKDTGIRAVYNQTNWCVELVKAYSVDWQKNNLKYK